MGFLNLLLILRQIICLRFAYQAPSLARSASSQAPGLPIGRVLGCCRHLILRSVSFLQQANSPKAIYSLFIASIC